MLQRSVLILGGIGAAIALAPVASRAQADVTAESLRRCAAIERGVERLDCYDAIAQSLASDPQERREPEEPSAASDGAEFGAELLGDGTDTQEIHSRIVGEFSGWRGNTEFRLENGQVWRQAEQDRVIYSLTAPAVTIRRGAFNTYRLSVEGVRRSIRVRRIR